jgi:hypothetical protein
MRKGRKDVLICFWKPLKKIQMLIKYFKKCTHFTTPAKIFIEPDLNSHKKKSQKNSHSPKINQMKRSLNLNLQSNISKAKLFWFSNVFALENCLIYRKQVSFDFIRDLEMRVSQNQIHSFVTVTDWKMPQIDKKATVISQTVNWHIQ